MNAKRRPVIIERSIGLNNRKDNMIRTIKIIVPPILSK